MSGVRRQTAPVFSPNLLHPTQTHRATLQSSNHGNFVTQPNVQFHPHQANTIINQRPITEPRPPQSRVQYVPYQNHYVDYEEQQVLTSVMVPVQRKKINYYAVERVTQYLPKQRQQTIIERVPQQKVTMRLQYVPVQTRIIHYPKGDGTVGTTIENLPLPLQQQFRTSSPMVQSKKRKLPSTNFVTSDNYVPFEFEDYEEEDFHEDQIRESQISHKN